MKKEFLNQQTDNYSDYERVVDTLLKHPEGVRTRTIAQNIVSLVFHAGRSLLLDEVSEDNEEIDKGGLKRCALNTADRYCIKPTGAKELMHSFRDEIQELLGTELSLNDDDMYNKIVYPLNMKQISNALKPKC